MQIEEFFYVLQHPNGKYVGPRQIDWDAEGEWAQTRYEKESFINAQRYATYKNAKLAQRYFKDSAIKEVKVTYEG